MAIELLCPECLSNKLEPYHTKNQVVEKFKCKSCGKVRLITKMQYQQMPDDDSISRLYSSKSCG